MSMAASDSLKKIIRNNIGFINGGFDIMAMTTTTNNNKHMLHHHHLHHHHHHHHPVVNEGAKSEYEVSIDDGDHNTNNNGEDAKHKNGNMSPPQQLPVSAPAPAVEEQHNYKHRPRTSSSYSQPIIIPRGEGEGGGGTCSSYNNNSAKPKDKRFDTFKTWSGRLERKINSFGGGQEGGGEEEEEETHPHEDDILVGAQVGPDEIHVDRYFDALEGPELDTLRVCEKSVLPEDEMWPFLLRFPISSFGICLGVSSQANMWKALSTAPSTQFLHVSRDVNLVLWLVSAALVTAVALLYALKAAFYFEAVRREYYHPVRVNFFFAPWIALLFLVLGVPPHFTEAPLHQSVWYVLMAPIFCLELKIYGQWMSGGQRRLSKVANPSNHLSIVGNFVGALVGATMGLKEGPLFFFSVGLAHYTVLFVTLYQRLPTNVTLPKELHPVFFLFVAAPSIASMAWAKIEGSFGFGSKIAYFVALFLYMSLAVRINFFRGFKFSVAWWAYTFPMTGAAVATIRYSSVVTTTASRWLTVVLCGISTLTVTTLLVTTVVHAFILRDLFPNDSAIAISDQRRHHHRRRGSRSGSAADHKDAAIDQYLKFADSSGAAIKDIEAANP